MTKTVTASQARNNFFAILREIKTPGVSIVITYEGHPEGVLMSVEEFESWQETLDIMSHPEEVAAIEEGMREKERGEVVTLEEFKKNLSL
ncbi:type II toxin-antitoxin system Phd/YefM family antitoxin [Candidatus Peregrinibacteria bacterium]|nr:type II toxin-antitoxin system Phd/YefM family antitoxin [Candidatus Peregrinibacteria bacterium]MBI3816118.1 type II toxin-antitoxin system Phd/YefM family antitoxin [Candidatus Peregrinibacteria bacterium]